MWPFWSEQPLRERNELVRQSISALHWDRWSKHLLTRNFKLSHTVRLRLLSASPLRSMRPRCGFSGRPRKATKAWASPVCLSAQPRRAFAQLPKTQAHKPTHACTTSGAPEGRVGEGGALSHGPDTRDLQRVNRSWVMSGRRSLTWKLKPGAPVEWPAQWRTALLQVTTLALIDVRRPQTVIRVQSKNGPKNFLKREPKVQVGFQIIL